MNTTDNSRRTFLKHGVATAAAPYLIPAGVLAADRLAAENLDFEKAIEIREKIADLRKKVEGKKNRANYVKKIVDDE